MNSKMIDENARTIKDYYVEHKCSSDMHDTQERRLKNTHFI